MNLFCLLGVLDRVTGMSIHQAPNYPEEYEPVSHERISTSQVNWSREDGVEKIDSTEKKKITRE